MRLKQKKWLLILILVLLSGLENFTLATQAKRSVTRKRGVQITGIFSNLTYIEDAGDVVGMEVFILNSNAGHFAMVQIAAGPIADPVLVVAKFDGNKIEFTLPTTAGIEPMGKYTGKITSTGLLGKFEKESKTQFLKRKKSYWQ